MEHLEMSRVDAILHSASDVDRESSDLVHLSVADMGCPSCGNRIRNSLLGVGGVVDVAVDLTAGIVTVWFDLEQVPVVDLTLAVEQASKGTHHQYLAVPVSRRD